MANRWKRPDAPPPPLFFGEKERNLVKQVNDELIEKVIGQQILYYPIDIVLYGEYYYEIVKLSEDTKLFGQVDYGFEISARCRRARKGLFDAT